MQNETYEQILQRKFTNLEKRIARTHREMVFLKHAYEHRRKAQRFDLVKDKLQQLDLFAI